MPKTQAQASCREHAPRRRCAPGGVIGLSAWGFGGGTDGGAFFARWTEYVLRFEGVCFVWPNPVNRFSVFGAQRKTHTEPVRRCFVIIIRFWRSADRTAFKGVSYEYKCHDSIVFLSNRSVFCGIFCTNIEDIV